MSSAQNGGMANKVEAVVKGLGEYVIQLSRDKWAKLVISVLIDIMGFLTYFIPVLAEFLDIFWAPLSSILIFQLYGSSLLTGIALIEEGLPFTDIIPTATIGWLCQFTFLGAWLGLNLREEPLRPNPRIRQMN
mmetsp:Transcript_34117/g.53200  ORF Transcript_34117/g.53200 Transcript_34117/m.53200 type:complete len:133 (+) Transcript_34117:59-457(+)|eukprot:CAMPEP_0184330244 /NCGR_PEP_ID=MMETSP1049-20130417/144581_1 /TAXON_ID=77928 /ORGANISM="Proteomonas sulcata, Strain CCMP704" /LENGTH=132 /DNA_ID=CAMNT_0026652667 /DNA_START=441 /DNA_END=842 /DNA_ORIENTATION=-